MLRKYMKKTAIALAVSLCITGTADRGILQGIHGTNVVSAATALNIPAKVDATYLNVRTKAGTKNPQLTVNKTPVSLKQGTPVLILSQIQAENKRWFQISFTYADKKYTGYVQSDFVKLTLTKKAKGKVTATDIAVKKTAGTKSAALKDGSKAITLKKDKMLVINAETEVGEAKWYQVSFSLNQKSMTGYIPASAVLLLGNVTSISVTVKPEATKKPAATQVPATGAPKAGLATERVRVRTGAGTNFAQMKDSEKEEIVLPADKKVTILSQKKVENTIWYQVSFWWKIKTLKGYVSGDFIKVTERAPLPTKTPAPSKKPTPTKTPVPTKTPAPTKTPVPSVSPTPTATPIPTATPAPTLPPMTEAEFEASLIEENFPESYKDSLRALHDSYPNWRFQAFHTELYWTTALVEEGTPGTNLLQNSKNIGWKSTESGAYDWENDVFIPFDGSTWVTASKAALGYYMDPRNFLTEDGIYQFETLSYQESLQTEAGVENILKNTPFSNAYFSYVDETTGQTITTTYGKAFMEAAKYSGVSPYHLASRVKQEVVTGTTSLSTTATGQYPGYEGHYNFFNIGAGDNAVEGQSRANAMKYAKNGGSDKTLNSLYMIPWNNPYKAILGGAQYIGSGYIMKGQNTLYLQKFNMTPNDTYNHQYMSNVEAPSAESKKIRQAYQSMMDLPIVFSIPVFKNMPDTPSPLPKDMKNPNNWLKQLSVEGQQFTSAFTPNFSGPYSVLVGNNISSVMISAVPVGKNASVSGVGMKELQIGTNDITITVTAEDGSRRNYFIQIIRQ